MDVCYIGDKGAIIDLLKTLVPEYREMNSDVLNSDSKELGSAIKIIPSKSIKEVSKKSEAASKSEINISDFSLSI